MIEQGDNYISNHFTNDRSSLSKSPKDTEQTKQKAPESIKKGLPPWLQAKKSDPVTSVISDINPPSSTKGTDSQRSSDRPLSRERDNIGGPSKTNLINEQTTDEATHGIPANSSSLFQRQLGSSVRETFGKWLPENALKALTGWWPEPSASTPHQDTPPTASTLDSKNTPQATFTPLKAKTTSMPIPQPKNNPSSLQRHPTNDSPQHKAQSIASQSTSSSTTSNMFPMDSSFQPKKSGVTKKLGVSEVVSPQALTRRDTPRGVTPKSYDDLIGSHGYMKHIKDNFDKAWRDLQNIRNRLPEGSKDRISEIYRIGADNISSTVDNFSEKKRKLPKDEIYLTARLNDGKIQDIRDIRPLDTIFLQRYNKWQDVLEEKLRTRAGVDGGFIEQFNTMRITLEEKLRTGTGADDGFIKQYNEWQGELAEKIRASSKPDDNFMERYNEWQGELAEKLRTGSRSDDDFMKQYGEWQNVLVQKSRLGSQEDIDFMKQCNEKQSEFVKKNRELRILQSQQSQLQATEFPMVDISSIGDQDLQQKIENLESELESLTRMRHENEPRQREIQEKWNKEIAESVQEMMADKKKEVDDLLKDIEEQAHNMLKKIKEVDPQYKNQLEVYISNSKRPKMKEMLNKVSPAISIESIKKDPVASKEYRVLDHIALVTTLPDVEPGSRQKHLLVSTIESNAKFMV